MRYDDILKNIGEFGRYQKYVCITICLLAIPSAWHSLGNTFLSAQPEHYCRTFPGQEYEEFSPTKNCTIPCKNKEWSKCVKYNRSEPFDQCKDEGVVLKCDQGWVYDNTFYESTAVTDFDLVCGQNSKRQLSKSLALAGKMVGSATFGYLADIVGRKPMFLFGIIMQVSVGVGASFSPSFPVFCALQFLLGVTASGVFVVAIVIATELVGPSKRAFAGMGVQYCYSIGYMSIALIAWRLRAWPKIELAISIPSAAFLSYYWLVPESPRWLFSKGRTEEAKKILTKAAKVNKVELPDTFLDQNLELEDVKKGDNNAQRVSAWALLRTPNMRFKTLIINFAWIANSMVYYGLAFFTEDLSSDPYLAFFISGAVDIPAYILCQLLLDHLGRRRLISGFMIIGSISLFSCIPIPNELGNVTLAFAMIGKFCISGSYAVVYLFATELFPTSIRNVGIGMGSFSGSICSILSPYILLLADIVSQELPFIIFGSFSFVAGILLLLLPETLGRKLPETLEEGELVGKGLSLWQRIKGDTQDEYDQKFAKLTENIQVMETDNELKPLKQARSSTYMSLFETD
ncbi:organic cation transporter protein-like [Amphiura filiformis]|uniref:organic cation transporter protein-like n=1 Tax=Amphiura filiformis TaxID=82378 RepID=UPI003B20FB58